MQHRWVFVWRPNCGRAMHRRVSGLVLVAFAVATLAAARPAPAFVAGVTVALRSTNGKFIPQGLPLEFEAKVTNSGSKADLVGFTFELARPDADESGVPFMRWERAVPAGGTVRVAGSVIPAQWFSQRGSFRIEAVSGDRVVGMPLSFEVTAPPVRLPRFKDVTVSAGLKTTLPNYLCPRWAAGAAWGDVEGDGDLDLYLPHQGENALLWINDGSGRFTNEARRRGVTNNAIGLSATFADYDNDGDQDLYVVNDGPNRLYQNDGSGFFTDVAASAGVDDALIGSSASWGDYDNDGYLDLYVTNYIDCASSNDPLTYFVDKLYHNEGDGTFSDRTGVLEKDPMNRNDGATVGAGFQAAWFDYDGDTDLDIYLGNDFVGRSPDGNHLWRNDGDGNFTDVSVASRTAFSMNTMGIGIGDYDRDLDLDIALSNIEENRLLRNNGDGTFTDVASQARVARPFQRVEEFSITWGLAFYDLNLDGWEDLYVAAGPFENAPQPQPNELFANGRNGKFLDLSAPSGAADKGGTSRGVAFADYDRDGRIDLYVVNQAGMPRLYRNVTSMHNQHWLEVDPVGNVSNRDGCGARLIVTINGKKMLRQVFCGSVSLGSGHDPAVHFGLGSADRVEELVIEWPSGIRQVLRNVNADRFIEVREPNA